MHTLYFIFSSFAFYYTLWTENVTWKILYYLNHLSLFFYIFLYFFFSLDLITLLFCVLFCGLVRSDRKSTVKLWYFVGVQSLVARSFRRLSVRARKVCLCMLTWRMGDVKSFRLISRRIWHTQRGIEGGRATNKKPRWKARERGAHVNFTTYTRAKAGI